MTQRFLPILPGADERACETFQWKIEDWSALDKRVTGPEFEIGGYKWYVDSSWAWYRMVDSELNWALAWY